MLSLFHLAESELCTHGQLNHLRLITNALLWGSYSVFNQMNFPTFCGRDNLLGHKIASVWWKCIAHCFRLVSRSSCECETWKSARPSASLWRGLAPRDAFTPWSWSLIMLITTYLFICQACRREEGGGEPALQAQELSGRTCKVLRGNWWVDKVSFWDWGDTWYVLSQVFYFTPK